MSTIICREATHHDAPSIIEFQIAMADETEGIALDPATVTKGVEAVFADPTLGLYFVASEGDDVVASLLITCEWSDWRNGMVWWIQSVYVRPAHRGAGTYRRLYEHVKAIVDADPNLRGLRLYVDERNQRAQLVYKNLGMDGDHYRVFEWMKGS